MNNQLNWDAHVKELCKKYAQRLHLLRTIKPFVTQYELHNIYTSTIRSLADYCCQVFVRLSAKHTEQLRRLEKRAHRIIFGEAPFNCACDLDGYKKRRELLSMNTLTDILENTNHILHDRAPKRFANSNRLRNFACRTTTRQNSFFPYTTLLINNFPTR